MKTENIPKYVWLGLKDRFWYEQCQKTFVDLFGEGELDLVTKLFAATSINTSLKSNVKLFRKAYQEIKNRQSVGKYLPNIRYQLERIRQGEELSGRKIRNFQKAMAGDPDAIVVDIWILRAFGMERKHMRHSGPHAGRLRDSGPTDRQYNEIEHWIHHNAYKRQIEPRQLQAMIWAGCRIAHGGDKQTLHCDLLIFNLKNLFFELNEKVI